MSWLSRVFKQQNKSRRSVIARYDAATTNPSNRRHWSATDSLSAVGANNEAVRKTLRERSRYEVANNCYAKGITSTLANAVIGTGPTIQFRTGFDAMDTRLNTIWCDWAEAIDLVGKLTTLRLAQCVDGESFGLLVNNPRVGHRIKLDLQTIEADQIATPDKTNLSPNIIDGIVFDDYGNPLEYHLLKHHPGDPFAFSLEYNKVDPRYVLHFMRVDRPGQKRGVPEITAALNDFAVLRRYTMATLEAAETAANYAAVISSDALPDTDEDIEADEANAWSDIQINRNTFTVLPAGWKMEQFKPEQPTTNFPMFIDHVLQQIGRVLEMPMNVVLGNSSKYNYASGRLDWQTWGVKLDIERRTMNRHIGRIIHEWLREAYASGVIHPEVYEITWEIFWPGRPHVDPAKEATATTIRLANGTTTLTQELAREGRNVQDVLRERAAEQALAQSLGIKLEHFLPPNATEQDESEDEQNSDQIDETSQPASIAQRRSR